MPIKVPTSEEARIFGKKGGIASGQARRAKRHFKDACQLLLQADCQNPKLQQAMTMLGIPKKEQSNLMTMVLALYNEAMKGNVGAFNALRDTMGENPKKQLELTGPDGAPLIPERALTPVEAKQFLQDLENSV